MVYQRDHLGRAFLGEQRSAIREAKLHIQSRHVEFAGAARRRRQQMSTSPPVKICQQRGYVAFYRRDDTVQDLEYPTCSCPAAALALAAAALALAVDLALR